ncbi:MAG TPA: hypothetical protein VHO49_07410 [Anaerolineales bacterium]|nr:hypothetical protein [Anaerolineales bacterium]
MNGKVLVLTFVLIAGLLSAAGCITVGTVGPSPSAAPANETGLSVAFVRDGNIQLWNESTGQTRTIVDTGDVIGVSMSDDGQLIAYLRRSAVQLATGEGIEQSALWAVDRNGGNPRELVSAESLRQRLDAGERESTNIPQMEWIPGTHSLLFSGWKYIVIAEGESHAVPEGLSLVDADALTDVTLIPAGNRLRFVPSPDGGQVALLSAESLGFIAVDGSSPRPDVLTYSSSMLPGPVFPTGVWTRDSSAFVIAAPLGSSSAGLDFSAWRVPVDGSAPVPLADILHSEPRSITFAPDGKHMAYVQFTDGQPPEIAGWTITPLTPEAGPLAVSTKIEFESFANLHWTPAGEAFTRNLRKLCPDATSDSNICDVRISFDGTPAAIQWIDGSRVLLLTRNPSVLFLGSMDFTGNMDGTTIPIIAWPLEDWVSSKSFTMAK